MAWYFKYLIIMIALAILVKGEETPPMRVPAVHIHPAPFMERRGRHVSSRRLPPHLEDTDSSSGVHDEPLPWGSS